MANDDLALVTGAPGWLGNRFVNHLVSGHPDYPDDAPQPPWKRVRCLVLPGTALDRLRELAPDAEIVEGDIRDAAAVGRFCAGADGATVFHLAGLIHPARRIRELFEINTQGTNHLLAAAAAAGVRRVVGTSSNSPVGVSRDPSMLFDESSPYRPYMAYGRSKKQMEDALNSAHRSGAVETVILRPCWFYGPDQPTRQTTFFSMIKDGKAPIVGDGEARRSMSYVDNTALGLQLAGAAPTAAGHTYWIADERPYSMNEIVDTVEDLLENEFGMQVAHDRMRLPSVASEVAMAIDAAIQAAGLYEQKIHVLSEMNKTIACSVERARRELGYQPTVELREGMRRSIEWCLANGQSI
jgi:nucleoside-diphosphate-sugar epimerase